MPTLLTTLIRKTPPVLPAPYCMQGYQQYANDIVNGMVLAFASDIGNIAYNYGDTLPTADNRIFPWFRTIAGYPDGWWVFASAGAGAWLQKYPWPAGGGLRIDWEDTELALLTYDGGEAAPASLIAGPFWEVDPAYAGRSTMAPGVVLGAVPAKTLSVGEDYGSGSTLLTADQIAAHTHPLAADTSLVDGNNIRVVTSGSGGVGLQIGGSGTASTALSVGANTPTAEQEALSVVHPVRAAFKIQRTGRLYRRIDV